MPLYDFECETCFHVQEDLFFLNKDFLDEIYDFCHKCGGYRALWVCATTPGIEDWGNCSNGRYFEDLSATGESFRSKSDFKRYMKEKGLQAAR